MDEHPNVERARVAYGALDAGDPQLLVEMLAEDVQWNIPGNNPLSGVYQGRDEARRLLTKRSGESDSSVTTALHDVLGNDRHLVVLSRFTAKRDGRQIEMNSINVFHTGADGRLKDRRLFVEDQGAVDEFWR
jgi:ketosteroid isomerase-like protein